MSRADIDRLAAIISPGAFDAAQVWAPGTREIRQADSIRKVRAILEAMREQTESQYDALCATGKLWREQTSQTVWQTHIDALLAD